MDVSVSRQTLEKLRMLFEALELKNDKLVVIVKSLEECDILSELLNVPVNRFTLEDIRKEGRSCAVLYINQDYNKKTVETYHNLVVEKYLLQNEDNIRSLEEVYACSNQDSIEYKIYLMRKELNE